MQINRFTTEFYIVYEHRYYLKYLTAYSFYVLYEQRNLQKLEVQSTAFPQNRITLCKTCEKETFFVRKVNRYSDLYQVEKKIVKMRLICIFVYQ